MAVRGIDLATPPVKARVVGADGSTLSVTEMSAIARPDHERGGVGR